jgi:hypothetical protein
MLIEATLLPRNLLNEGNQIHYQGTHFYSVSVRTFVIPFYYCSGSANAKSYGSGSATLVKGPETLKLNPLMPAHI